MRTSMEDMGTFTVDMRKRIQYQAMTLFSSRLLALHWHKNCRWHEMGQDGVENIRWLADTYIRSSWRSGRFTTGSHHAFDSSRLYCYHAFS